MVGGTQASSTIKTGRHDIAEILLKVALNTKNQIKSYILSNGIYSFNIGSVLSHTILIKNKAE
jgi:hypothetical protein